MDEEISKEENSTPQSEAHLPLLASKKVILYLINFCIRAEERKIFSPFSSGETDVLLKRTEKLIPRMSHVYVYRAVLTCKPSVRTPLWGSTLNHADVRRAGGSKDLDRTYMGAEFQLLRSN